MTAITYCSLLLFFDPDKFFDILFPMFSLSRSRKMKEREFESSESDFNVKKDDLDIVKVSLSNEKNVQKTGLLKMNKILETNFKCMDSDETNCTEKQQVVMKINATTTTKHNEEEKNNMRQLHSQMIEEGTLATKKKVFMSSVTLKNHKPTSQTMTPNFLANTTKFFPQRDLYEKVTAEHINYEGVDQVNFINGRLCGNFYKLGAGYRNTISKIHLIKVSTISQKHHITSHINGEDSTPSSHKNENTTNLPPTVLEFKDDSLINKKRLSSVNLKKRSFDSIIKNSSIDCVKIQNTSKTNLLKKKLKMVNLPKTNITQEKQITNIDLPPVDNTEGKTSDAISLKCVTRKTVEHHALANICEIFDVNTNEKSDLTEIKKELDIKTINFSELPSNPTKINEASFSEVFRVMVDENNKQFFNNVSFGPTIVLKICEFNEFYTENNFIKECYTVKKIDELKSTCKMHSCYFVNGEFTEEYINARNVFGSRSETGSSTLHNVPKKYGCVFLENGGEDLETFKFASFEESVEFMTKLLMHLVKLQHALKYEHRDLHWGNVLLKRTNVMEIGEGFELENKNTLDVF